MIEVSIHTEAIFPRTNDFGHGFTRIHTVLFFVRSVSIRDNPWQKNI